MSESKLSSMSAPSDPTNQIDGAFYESNQQQLSEISREDILRQVFGDVGDLIDDFSCAVETSVLLHGRMYVTSRFLCFYSNLFGLEKKIRIPYSHITQITKENTVLVIPNAIAITTYRKEYLFRSFWDRDECFRILRDFIDTYKNGVTRRSSLPPVPMGRDAGGSHDGDGAITQSMSNTNLHAGVLGPLLGELLPQDDSDSEHEEGQGQEEDDEDEEGEDGADGENEGEGDNEVSEDEDEDLGFSLIDSAAGPQVSLESMTPEQLAEAYREEEAKSRLKISVTSAVMALSVAEFAEVFVEDGAIHSWLVYHDLVEDTSLELSAWADMPNTLLGKARELKFYKPVNLPGLKSTRGVKVQRYRRFGDAGLVVCSSTRLEDVPAADTFSVEDMVSVQRVHGPAGEDMVQVEITFEVYFLKTTIFKYLIERNTQSEMQKWLEAFFAHMQRCAVEYRLNGAKLPSLAIDAAQRRRSVSEGARVDSKALKRLASFKGDERGGMMGALDGVLKRLAGGRAFWAAWMLLFLALLLSAWQWKGVNARLDRLNARMADMLELQRAMAAQCSAPSAKKSKK